MKSFREWERLRKRIEEPNTYIPAQTMSNKECMALAIILKPVQDMLKYVKDNPAVFGAILGRIYHLLFVKSFDQKYRHPHDLPIAMYLYILHEIDPKLAKRACVGMYRRVVLMNMNLYIAASMMYSIYNDINEIERLSKGFISDPKVLEEMNKMSESIEKLDLTEIKNMATSGPGGRAPDENNSGLEKK